MASESARVSRTGAGGAAGDAPVGVVLLPEPLPAGEPEAPAPLFEDADIALAISAAVSAGGNAARRGAGAFAGVLSGAGTLTVGASVAPSLLPFTTMT